MMQRIIIVCFIFFFFTTSYSMDQSDSLEPIAADKLHKYVGKIVVYKESDTCHKPVLLGQQIAETNYYKGYIAEDKTQGICCSGDRLYKQIIPK